MREIHAEAVRKGAALSDAIRFRHADTAHRLVDQMIDLGGEYDALLAATQAVAGEESQDWQAAA